MAHSTVAPNLLRVAVCVADSDGVRQIRDEGALRAVLDSDKLSWIDIALSQEKDVATILRAMDLEEPDRVWLQRFGQTGRMSLGQEKIRAVTWIADRNAPTFGPLIEIHVLARKNFILTIWNGDPECLSEVRHHYYERSSVLEKNLHHATSILLQLLFSTLDLAMAELDARLQTLQSRVIHGSPKLDLGAVAIRMQSIQAVWSDLDRYSSSVRSAIVGIEALAGMHDRAAIEMNDYGEQVEDVEHRLQDRSRWLTNIMQDHASHLAAKQGEQINRLTIVSMVFMPITWLTGFFGMNFDWLNKQLSGAEAFFIFGVLLPIVCVIGTLYWFRRRGLM